MTAFVGAATSRASAAGEELLTVAESSDFTRTATHAEVVVFLERLAASSRSVSLSELGRSHDGRSIPLVIIADPPVATAEEALRAGKPVALLIGNIHGGEVCGKEALLMLARELGAPAGHAGHRLLDTVIVAMVPLYNPDRNERFSPENRATQNGPAQGVGVRQNGQGLDLNRDHIKLEAPETRALVRFLGEWDPALIIDTHTTNGSYHRYQLTYDGPRNPAGDRRVIEYVRDTMLPEITRRLRDANGIETCFYGNFNDYHTRWESYPAFGRYGTQYGGIRNRLAVLSEAYAYSSYRERVLSTHAFVSACLEFLARERGTIQDLIRAVDASAVDAGRKPAPDDLVAIASRAASAPDKVQVKGYVEESREGRSVATDAARDYEVELVNRFDPVKTVRRPYAYLIPAELAGIIEKLREHGLELETLREDIDLSVEAYRIDVSHRADVPFQGRRLTEVSAPARQITRRVSAGTVVLRLAQPLGALAVYLLEPESEDGLCLWSFFEGALTVGSDYPVLRVLEPAPLLTAPLEVVEGGERKPITFEAAYESPDPPQFGGSPVGPLPWLPDGEHFLQSKDGRLWRVDARTGACEEALDVESVATALARVPTIDEDTARGLLSGTDLPMDAARAAFVIEHENDIYYHRLGEESARRLTSSPVPEELFEFSPDGRFVSFVRENDLWVADVATATERALTSGGHDTLRRGKADWVYFEEVFHRSWKTSWWSPDSRRIAFLEIDSRPVRSFTLVDDLAQEQRIEVAPYPKPGEPNPRARIGIVSAGGGDVGWVDLSGYDEEDVLITGVGWWPDGSAAYCFLQNRIQTWLDFCEVPAAGGGRPRRLFRDRTAAWVDPPLEPVFLADGSFLVTTERSGWRHLHHYARDGSLIGAVTSGEWQVTSVHRLDEAGGCVYVSGSSASRRGRDLYRVALDGSARATITAGGGVHRVEMSPAGGMFIDRWSTRETPPQAALFDVGGSRLRMIDSNPVPDLEAYRFQVAEHFEIETRDGYRLDATLLRPPDFDPGKRYPVWFMTYGGPAARTVWDSWSGTAWDQVLAEEGFLVFRCDPRTASDRGVVSTWPAYRRLGVEELKDIVDAVGWLAAQPYVDASRIGMSGHSYGGFLTSYAMTHTTLFAAGIAGAPVTDWRDYDSIYTERYMSTPQDNPEGYSETSVVEAASRLHGRLLLLHGTMDDNVHIQNTYRLVRELPQAERPFELMVYPGARHGIQGDHYERLKFDFIRRTLGGAAN